MFCKFVMNIVPILNYNFYKSTHPAVNNTFKGKYKRNRLLKYTPRDSLKGYDHWLYMSISLPPMMFLKSQPAGM